LCFCDLLRSAPLRGVVRPDVSLSRCSLIEIDPCQLREEGARASTARRSA
jgi:hypothetical protein